MYFFSLKYINSFKNPLLSCSFTIVASFSPLCCQLFVVGYVPLLWTFHSAFKSFPCVSKTLEYCFASSLKVLFFFSGLLLILIAKGVCFGLVSIVSARIFSAL